METVRDLNKKITPQAIDLEIAVLGAMLIDARGIDEALDIVSKEDFFYLEKHKYIYKAIKILNNSNNPIDILSVSEQLKKLNKLKFIGGDYYLLELTQKVSSAAHIEYHSRILMQKYIKRELIKTGNNIVSNCYKSNNDIFDILDSAELKITEITDLINNGKRTSSWSESLSLVTKRVEFLTNNKTDITGVTTGLNKLDIHFGGWQKQDFIVIGARPGMGKTAFTVNNMIAAAKSGVPVGFMSMEMSDVQLATRAVAVNSDFHMRQLNKTGFEHSKYFKTLNNLVNEMQSLPIYIEDRPSLTISDIKRTARSWKRKHNIGLLIVDYIQLAGGNNDIRIRTGETSRGLKHIAKELNIPVVGLSQLSRAVETTTTKRPSLHHLKEAGDIEQDADIVSFIYRPEYYALDPDPDNLNINENTEFITSKNRNGALGVTGIWFEGDKTKFLDNKPNRNNSPF